MHSALKFKGMEKTREGIWGFNSQETILQLDIHAVHKNTLRVNTIFPILIKVRALLESRLRPRPVRRRRIEVQLEFPWSPKR